MFIASEEAWIHTVRTCNIAGTILLRSVSISMSSYIHDPAACYATLAILPRGWFHPPKAQPTTVTGLLFSAPAASSTLPSVAAITNGHTACLS